MELPLKCVSSKWEVHTMIRACFFTSENLSVSAIHKRLQNVYSINVMPECIIHSVSGKFQDYGQKSCLNGAISLKIKFLA